VCIVATADEVRRHQGLAVPGAERVQRAEPEREQHREQHQRPGALDEIGERTAHHARSSGRRPGCGRARAPVADAHARRERRRGGPAVERARQQVLRVGPEPVGDARRRHVGAGHREPVDAGERHLVPADPPVEVRVGEVDGAARSGQRPRERRLEPQDVEPALTREQRGVGADDLEPHGPAVDAQVEVPEQRRGRPARVGRALVERDHAVTVGVELRSHLDRRDLGHVDDVVDACGPRRKDDPRRRVDREVAERMRRRERRDEQHADDHGGRHEQPRRPSHAEASSESSARRATPA
jgi:hypothetical protein